jgi:hypothetical protein
MSWSTMVGLLAAAGAIMTALVGLLHGDRMPFTVLGAGITTGLAAYMALPTEKKYQLCYQFFRIPVTSPASLGETDVDSHPT